MRSKIVVGGREDDRTVDFKQGLPILLSFLDVAILHRPDSFLRLPERSGENRVQHQACAAGFPSFVRCFDSAGCLPRELECKRRLSVSRSRSAQEDGPGMGRIRMRRIPDASAESLVPFVQDSVATGSIVHSDGWLGYLPLESKGYVHEVTFLRGRKKSPSELMPRVHQVVSLLKRWLMGTHQGAVSQEHLDYYLDEFTFRFNRRRSRSRGKLFFRLLQQAVVIEPVPYKSMIRCAAVAVSPDHKILGLHE